MALFSLISRFVPGAPRSAPVEPVTPVEPSSPATLLAEIDKGLRMPPRTEPLLPKHINALITEFVHWSSPCALYITSQEEVENYRAYWVRTAPDNWLQPLIASLSEFLGEEDEDKRWYWTELVAEWGRQRPQLWATVLAPLLQDPTRRACAIDAFAYASQAGCPEFLVALAPLVEASDGLPQDELVMLVDAIGDEGSGEAQALLETLRANSVGNAEVLKEIALYLGEE